MGNRLLYGAIFFLSVATWVVWAPIWWIITGKDWIEVFVYLVQKSNDLS